MVSDTIYFLPQIEKPSLHQSALHREYLQTRRLAARKAESNRERVLRRARRPQREFRHVVRRLGSRFVPVPVAADDADHVRHRSTADVRSRTEAESYRN